MKLNLKRTSQLFTYTVLSFVLVVSGYQPAAAYLINKEYVEKDITQFDERVSLENEECSDVPQDDGGPIGDINVGDEPKERRVNLIKLFMNTFDLSSQQAAGIIGNFAVEAGFYARDTGGGSVRPDINQGDTGAPTGSPPDSGDLGYGWAQWSNHLPGIGRKTAFRNFLRNNPQWVNEGRATDMANIQYLKKELESTYRATLPALKRTSNPYDAMRSFERTFEKAGSPDYATRGRWAEQAHSEYLAAGGGGDMVDLGDGGDPVPCEDDDDGGGIGEVPSARFDQVAFPLKTTQAAILRGNAGVANGTFTNTHPNYTAYDIMIEAGTEVVAFASGEVTYESTDVCGGNFITIWNEEARLGVTYMHMTDHIREGTRVEPGDHVGTIGTSDGAACGSGAHLHIDVATDKIRGPCARPENGGCSIADHFRSISSDLHNAYKRLPER